MGGKGNSPGGLFSGHALYAYREGTGQRMGLLGRRYGSAGGIRGVAREEESGTTSGGGGGGSGAWGRNEPRSAQSASITRGGFGGQATARSGWGGRSGSFFGG